MQLTIPFHVTRCGDVSVIDVAAALEPSDKVTVESLQDLDELIADEGPRKLLLDFNFMEWDISPVMLHMIDLADSLAHPGCLKLARVPVEAQNACKLLSLNGTHFSIYRSTEDALNAFRD